MPLPYLPPGSRLLAQATPTADGRFFDVGQGLLIPQEMAIQPAQDLSYDGIGAIVDPLRGLPLYYFPYPPHNLEKGYRLKGHLQIVTPGTASVVQGGGHIGPLLFMAHPEGWEMAILAWLQEWYTTPHQNIPTNPWPSHLWPLVLEPGTVVLRDTLSFLFVHPTGLQWSPEGELELVVREGSPIPLHRVDNFYSYPEEARRFWGHSAQGSGTLLVNGHNSLERETMMWVGGYRRVAPGDNRGVPAGVC